MKRLALPLLALVLAAGIASTAPVVNTWDSNVKVVWNDTLGQAATETTFTDSVAVFGARAVMLLVKSSGSDTLTVPVLQTRLPNGTWTYLGGAGLVPPSSPSVATGTNAATAVTSTTRFSIGWYNEWSSGGTPVPFSNVYFRWRVRANNVRGNGASGKTPSGTITYSAVVLN